MNVFRHIAGMLSLTVRESVGENEKNVLCAFIVIAAQRFHRCPTRAGSVNRWGRVAALDVVFVIWEFGMLDLGFFEF